MNTSVMTKNPDSFNESINTHKTKNKVDRYEWWFDLPTSDVSSKSPSVEFDVEDITKVDSVADLEPQTPLTGLSDSANLQVFYEKDGLSVKVTYAWRDSYLIGVGQGQGSSDAPPQFAKEFGQVDMSVNYDIDENFTVFFEGLNLNNETEQAYGRYEEQFLFARQYGSRYTLGVRYSFK